MKKFLSLAVFAIVVAVCFVACDNNNNYPDNYLGFDQKSTTFTYDKNADEADFTVKIIAGDKSKEDRPFTISTNGAGNTFCKIENPNMVMPAGKKSIKVNLKIYPKEIGITRSLFLTCTPKDSKIEATSISISLEKKK